MQFFCVFVTSVHTHTHTDAYRCTLMHVHTILVTSLLFCIHVIIQNTFFHKFSHTIFFTYHSSHSSASLHTHNYTYSSSQILSFSTTKNTYTHATLPTDIVRHLPGVWKCGSRKVGMGVTSGRALLKASIKFRRIQSRAKRPLVDAILPLDWFLPPLAFITFRYTLFCNRHWLAVDHAVYLECPKQPFFMPLELIVCKATQSEIK